MKRILIMTLILLAGLAVIGLQGHYTVAADEPAMGTYATYPLSLSSMIKPNVLVVMDTSTSLMAFAYTGAYSPATAYDGLFDSDATYSYNSAGNYFETPKNAAANSKGVNYWEGRFLNWACMRRIDIAKIVLSGGEYVKDGSTHLIKGFTYPNNTGWSGGFETTKSYNYDGSGGAENYTHQKVDNLTGPYFQISSVGATNFYVRVKVNAPPSGIIQDMAAQVRFGLEIYSPNDDADQGGKVVQKIGSNAVDIANSVNDQKLLSDPVGKDTWTPMAETLFTAAGYFGQVGGTNTNGPRYHANDYTVSDPWDPYYSAGGSISCVKSYVIFISDGEANRDSNVQAYARSGVTGEILGADNYFDNVAYWIHTTDLRAGGPGFGKALTGTQSLTLYTISTFGGGTALLQSAAKYGGFIDTNGNNFPDLNGEWDKDGNSIPDNFYSAATVSELKKALADALVNILSQSSSGSAVSIISNNDQGEGTIIQAYYRSLRAATAPGDPDIKWLGYLHSFWLDDRFNLREDSDTQDQILDKTNDKIITFFVDPLDGNVKIARYPVTIGDPYGESGTSTVIDISDVKPLWDAGQRLAQRNAGNRKIFTGLDTDNNGVIDTGLLDFSTLTYLQIKPYLGVADFAFWSYLGATHDDRSKNLIQWIRGEETGLTGADVRSRKIGATIWKLGDIVDSSPVTVTNPLQRYDVLYGDMTFSAYYQYVSSTLERESVVYVGANDGMLHAFTAGKFNKALNKYEKNPKFASPDIGDELWAYIPQAVLPHLKWLASKNYLHTYYVNMTPVVWDVQIFDPPTGDATHPGGWGTILLCGLNMGGKAIQVTDVFGGVSETRTFSPSYFALDITNPREPELLWERTYTGLGLSTSKPAIIKAGTKWFAVFGSGPTNYDGTSTQAARVFVVDLEDGKPHKASGNDWRFIASGVSAFMNSPTARDHQLDFSVDDVYFGESYYSGTTWNGKAWRLHIDAMDEDPNNWKINNYFTVLGAPITAPIAVGKCLTPETRVATYFGTGRYMGEDDKTSTEQQYLMKVNDPLYNPSAGYSISKNVLLQELCEWDPNSVHGWYYELPYAKERSLTKPIVFGGVVIYTSFVPNQDLCGYGGDGYLWVAKACGLCGGTITGIKLPPGNPSVNQTVLIPGGGQGAKVDVLGRQPNALGQQGTVMSQSAGVLNPNQVSLEKIPRTRFFYWREN